MTQAGYIRWWIWAASVLLFGGVLWLASGQDSKTVWVAAALTPFLALLMVVENGKSRFYGMEGLELSCRMSLRTVVLTRIMILRLFHLFLLGVLIPSIAVWGGSWSFPGGAVSADPLSAHGCAGNGADPALPEAGWPAGLRRCGGAGERVGVAAGIPAARAIPAVSHASVGGGAGGNRDNYCGGNQPQL